MTAKTLLLSALLLLVLAGVIMAGVGNHWWKTSFRAPVAGKNLPTAAVEYDRIRERFRGGDSAMDIGGTVRLYDGERGGELKESTPFRSVRYGAQYFTQLSYLRTWCDGKLVLVVDTVHRRMQVSKPVMVGPKGSDLSTMPVNLLFSDTALFRFTGSVSQEGTERILTLHSDYNPEIKASRVYYDTANYRLRRLEVEWWKDRSGRDTAEGKIWLAKVEYVYHSRDNMNIGDEMRSYITVGRNGIMPTARYAGYEVKINF